MAEPTEDQIRQRAHQLWEQAGKPENREQEFWFEAERELKNAENARRCVGQATFPGECHTTRQAQCHNTCDTLGDNRNATAGVRSCDEQSVTVIVTRRVED